MSYLDPVIVELGFTSEEQIKAFKALLELTGLGGILSEEFKDELEALEKLKQATQGTEETKENPAWLRQPRTERWDIDDNDKIKTDTDKYTDLFTQLGLFEKKEPKQQDYDVVLLFGARQACVEERLGYLCSLLKDNKLKVKQLVLLGGQRPLMKDREAITDTLQEKLKKEPTELDMMKALVNQRVEDGVLKGVDIVPINAASKEDGRRPSTADTILEWLEKKPLDVNASVLAISNQPHIAYQEAVLKGILDKESLLDSIGLLETVGSALGTLGEREKISIVLDALARCIYASYDRLKKSFEAPAQGASQEETSSLRPAAYTP